MLCLSIETSTKTCSVALVDGEQALGEITINSEMTHSQKLLPAVDMLLNSVSKKLDDISLIGVAVGPGSFTGLRIGIATAKGLAYGKQIPIVGISTLDALAYLAAFNKQIVVPILNARRSQVYTGIYSFEGEGIEKILTDSVIKLNELVEKLNDIEGDILFIGDGVPVFKEKLAQSLGSRSNFMPQFNYMPRAITVGYLAIKKYKQIGGEDPYTIKPEYLRLSEAERNLLKGCKNGG